MTVKVAEASVDMLTPPCSPNSCLEVANAAAGSSHVEGMPVDNIAFLLATIQSSSPSCPVDDLFLPAKTKPCWFLVSAMPTPLKKSRRKKYAEMGWRGRGFMLLYIRERGVKCV
jgi:hypothetical protein